MNVTNKGIMSYHEVQKVNEKEAHNQLVQQRKVIEQKEKEKGD